MINKLLLILIRMYQKFISPALRPSCRFYPTCSNYAIQACKQYTTGHALFLIIKRLLRCQPWGGHGYDPLPSKLQDKKQ